MIDTVKTAAFAKDRVGDGRKAIAGVFRQRREKVCNSEQRDNLPEIQILADSDILIAGYCIPKKFVMYSR